MPGEDIETSCVPGGAGHEINRSRGRARAMVIEATVPPPDRAVNTSPDADDVQLTTVPPAGRRVQRDYDRILLHADVVGRGVEPALLGRRRGGVVAGSRVTSKPIRFRAPGDRTGSGPAVGHAV